MQNLSAELLATVNSIQREFILNDNPRSAFAILLESLITLTGSEYGFVGEVLRDAQNAPYLKTYAITNIAWNAETRKFYDEYNETGMEFHNLETLFGKVLATGKHLIANEPATHPDRGGLPDGHPSLDAFLGLPIFAGEEFAGMAGVANRKGGYDEALIEEIRPILEAGAYMISASRERKRRHEIERDLNTSLMQRDSIVDTALDSVIGMDHKGRIFEFNPAAERTFGWSRSEVLGRPLADTIIPENLREAHRKGFARYLSTGKRTVIGKRIELNAIRRSGEQFPVEFSITEIVPEPEGQPVFISYLRDITDRKLAEAALTEARESAESASVAKSSFISTISHEIRTPLNAIMGALGLLDSDQLDPDSRTFLKTARTSADALLGLVNDVLDFSRIEATQMKIEPVPFTVTSLCDGVIQVLSQKANASQIEIGYIIRAGVPAMVTADLGKIRQVLLNLVGNAVKFCDQGEVLVEVWPDEEGLRFTVSDTGIGIANEDIERLFEEFVQVGERRFRGGAGLGLIISKRLVELMGGKVYVHSNIGHGSTFWFTVPCQASEPTERPMISFPSKKVIVVGGSDFQRKIIEAQLTACEVELILTADISDALGRLVKKGAADSMILINDKTSSERWLNDVKQLNDRSNEYDVPLILVERLAGPDFEPLGRKFNFSSLLQLPVTIEDLIMALAITFGEDTKVKELYRTQSQPRYLLSEGIRVLLAEDSQANRLIVAEILRRDGFTVDVVADGLEATEAARTLPYDVILMDIDMPEMDGLEATRAIRDSEHEGDHIPIIALTAHATTEDRERFVSEGMDDYVSKPLNRPLLFNKLLYWAGRTLDQSAAEVGHRVPAAGSADSSDGLLDRHALSQLVEDTSPETARRIIAVFVEELRARAGQIAEYRDRCEMGGLASEAHVLKSSAATYGAAIIRVQSLRLDGACTNGDMSTAMDACRDLLAAVEPTAEALIAYTAEIGGETESDVGEH
jgi:PAS domain S-box-containing protein